MMRRYVDLLSGPHPFAARPARPGSWFYLYGAQSHKLCRSSSASAVRQNQGTRPAVPAWQRRRFAPATRPSAPPHAGAGGDVPAAGAGNAAKHRQPASASRLGECWRWCQKSPGILCDVRLSGVHRQKHL